MKEENVKVIYIKELLSDSVAEMIAEATGAEIVLLHSCHNVSKKDYDNNKTYLINADIDFNDGLKAKLETTIFGKTLQVVILDNKAFVTFDNLKVQTSLEDIKELANLILPNLPTEFAEKFDFQQIESLLEKFENFDIKELFSQVDLSSFNLNDYLAEITLDSEKLGIKLFDDNFIYINFANENELKLTGKYSNISIDLSLKGANPSQKIEIEDETSFSNLLDLTPVLNFAKELCSSKKLAGTISLYCQQKNYQVNFKVGMFGSTLDFDNLYAELETTILGKDVQVIIENGNIFVSFDQLKLQLATNSIENLLSQLPQNENSEILSTIQNILKSINLLNWNNNGLNIDTTDANLVFVFENDTIGSISFSLNGLNIVLDEMSFDFEKVNTADSEFLEKFTVIMPNELIENINSFVQSKKYSVQFDVLVQNTALRGNISVDCSGKELKAYIRASLYDTPLQIWLSGTQVFASFDKYNIKLNLEDIESVLDIVSRNS